MVLLDTSTPGTSREIYNEDTDEETRAPNPSVIKVNLGLLAPGVPMFSPVEPLYFSDEKSTTVEK